MALGILFAGSKNPHCQLLTYPMRHSNMITSSVIVKRTPPCTSCFIRVITMRGYILAPTLDHNSGYCQGGFYTRACFLMGVTDVRMDIAPFNVGMRARTDVMHLDPAQLYTRTDWPPPPRPHPSTPHPPTHPQALPMSPPYPMYTLINPFWFIKLSGSRSRRNTIMRYVVEHYYYGNADI